MRHVRMVLLSLGLAVPSLSAHAEPCALLEVKTPDQAELKVYFTRFVTEDKTQGRYKLCAIVTTEAPQVKKFLVTPFRQDANLIVHRSNWP